MAKLKKVPQKKAQRTSRKTLLLMAILDVASLAFLGVAIWRYW